MVLKYVKMTECGSGLIRMILIRIILIFKWQYYVSTISYDSMILLVFFSHYSYVILLSVLSQGNANKKEKQTNKNKKLYFLVFILFKFCKYNTYVCVFFVLCFCFSVSERVKEFICHKIGQGDALDFKQV